MVCTRRQKPRASDIDEKIEHFLKTESELAVTKWGLRKNAGFGSLIQKFITNFMYRKYGMLRLAGAIQAILGDRT